MSSATVKQDETHPLSITHTIFAIHKVIPHGIAMPSLNLPEQIKAPRNYFVIDSNIKSMQLSSLSQCLS